MNKNNLNRIKGILSAKQGTLIPKFLRGNILYHKKTGEPIFRIDQSSNLWFTDGNYQNLFIGDLNDYILPELSQSFNTKNSTDLDSLLKGFPNLSQYIKNINFNQQPQPSINKPYDLIANPPIGINGIQNFNNEFEIHGGIQVDPNALAKEAAQTNQQYHASLEQRKLNEEILKDVKTISKRLDNISLNTTPEFNPTYREVLPVEDNLKLSRKDRKIAREMKVENIPEDVKANIAQGVSEGIQTLGNAFGAAQQATDSNLTKGISAGYDGVANVVSSLGPLGLVIGGAMKALGALGDMSQAMGGGTDLQTKLDSWMDSPLLSWNIGMLNGFVGKNSNAFGADQDILAKAGSSYGGTTSTIMDAAESADKKYGLFSWKSRKKANETIAKAQSQQNLMGDIANTAADLRLAVQSMGEQAGLAYSLMTDGGYNQKYTYAAKEGGVLDWTPEIKINWEPKIEINWELPLFKDGGEIEWVPELQKGGDLEWVPKLLEGRTLEELIEYAKKQNPRFVQRLQEDPVGIKFTDDDGNEVEGSHYLEWSTDDLGNAIVYPRIQEMENGELRFLSSKEAYKRAVKNNNILVMTPEEAQTFFEEDPEYLVAYKRGFPDFFNKFKQGGSLKDSNAPEIEETTQKNVIPEGALHKNKHHMEHAEGLTKKGIPVIDEEGEQQAEIEHSEIIFTLEVTKKLEEYYEIFYSEESTNKEKEQAALDAGKLLVYQILENTEDRTGLIDSCKKGGILTHKISNDSVKEISEWIPNIVIIEKEFEKNPKNKEKSEKDNIKDMIKEVLIEILTGK